MNILLLGSGGREHALAWKLAQSKQCKNLFVAPGNAGTNQVATNVNLNIGNFAEIEQFVNKNQVSLIVVGPEQPLVDGVYDYFTERKIAVIGPSKKAAQLEGSKAYAKQFMQRHNIPTAGYLEVTEANLNQGKTHIENGTTPVVLKADGLAAGKGVLIINDKETAKNELENMITNNKFGAASSKVVIEEFLDGIEFSVFVLTDGSNYAILPNAKDYKRIGEGDTGLNTGGMGAISPVPFVTESLMQTVENEIIKPTIAGLKQEKTVYKGFIYFGLILVNGQPKVIEYNCRMGDPETQVVMPRLETDLLDLFNHVTHGTLNTVNVKHNKQAACTIVLASGGYPENYEKNKVITLGNTNASLVFHAGVKQQNNQLLTNGGRVITVTSFGETIAQAKQTSVNSINQINFEGKYFRNDIGYEF